MFISTRTNLTSSHTLIYTGNSLIQTLIPETVSHTYPSHSSFHTVVRSGTVFHTLIQTCLLYHTFICMWTPVTHSYIPEPLSHTLSLIKNPPTYSPISFLSTHVIHSLVLETNLWTHPLTLLLISLNIKNINHCDSWTLHYCGCRHNWKDRPQHTVFSVLPACVFSTYVSLLLSVPMYPC